MDTREYVRSHLRSDFRRFSRTRYEDLLRLTTQAGQEPAKERRGGKRSGKLNCNKSWDVLKTDSREGVGECTRDRNRGIGKGR